MDPALGACRVLGASHQRGHGASTLWGRPLFQETRSGRKQHISQVTFRKSSKSKETRNYHEDDDERRRERMNTAKCCQQVTPGDGNA